MFPTRQYSKACGTEGGGWYQTLHNARHRRQITQLLSTFRGLGRWFPLRALFGAGSVRGGLLLVGLRGSVVYINREI